MNESIIKYFPNLSTRQFGQFEALLPLYIDWNNKINLISRKDMKNFHIHHVLHSLSIARFIQFANNTRILDVGTGGGFPGIPLAILFPDVRFHLIDSIGKKIKVVNAIIEQIGLQNVTTEHVHAKNIREKYDFILSRAVTTIAELLIWLDGKVSKQHSNVIANGIICLKGGDITTELKEIMKIVTVSEISIYFKEEFFTTKKIVYIPL